MLQRKLIGAIALFMALCGSAMGAERSPGERRAALAALVKHEAEAGSRYAAIQAEADQALEAQPNPIKTIVSEGTLWSNPERQRTYRSLPDMDKMGALAAAAAVTGEPKYADKLHEFLLAWASTNVSEGNPINDMKLEQAFVAYGDFRDTFSGEPREVMDRWLRATGEALIGAIGKRPDCATNNWMSHRLKMIGLAGFIVGDEKLRNFAVTRYRQQIGDNLLPSGSSVDLEDRDALHYHCYDLEPLLTLAIAADQAGIDLYSYQAASGASLPKSLAYLVPFCDGTKTHPEFAKSKVDFDRQRAASGDASYKAGSLFDPHMGIHSLELGIYFEPKLVPLVAKLAGNRAARYPTWQVVVNEAGRRQ